MGSACSCISTPAQPPVDSASAPSVVNPASIPLPSTTTDSTSHPTTIIVAPANTHPASTTSTDTNTTTVESSLVSTSTSESTMADKAKIAVIYYSTWGHIHKMAQAVVKGAEAAGAQVTLLQIAETLPAEVLAKMHAAPKADVPVVQVADLVNYDGLIFGAPTRYGSPCAQYKALWDATGQLWQTGALNGKVAAFFTGTATLGGGQETTASTNMGHFVHHGMIFVPLGYGDPSIFSLDEVHGGSPWGAGTLSAGDGSRQPSALELGLATYQGKRVAEITAALRRGRAAQ